LKDITTRADIELLVRSFYEKALTDDHIGFFFTKVAAIDLEEHLPILFQFWETALLGAMTYEGNPMLKHIELNRKSPLKPDHFDRWLELWCTTVNEHFSGEKASEAIQRAQQIAGLMKFKVEQLS